MSSDGDLQLGVTTRLGMLFGDLGKIGSGMKGIGTATGAVSKAFDDMQNRVSRSFKGMEQKAKSFREAMKEVGEALHKGGGRGELGHLGHGIDRIAGVIGMDGGFGMLAAGALAGTVALKALEMAMDRVSERMEDMIEAQKHYREVAEAAKRQLAENANAGLDEDGTVRELSARGGSKAVKKADEYANNFALKPDDARKAFADSLDLPRAAQVVARAAAGLMAGTGMMSASEAVGKIKDNPSMTMAAMNSGKDPYGAAKRIESMLISGARGIPYKPTLGNDANFNVGTEPLNAAADAVQIDKNRGDVNNRTAALTGAALAEQIRDRVRREHPMEASATDDFLKYNQDLKDNQQRAKEFNTDRNSLGMPSLTNYLKFLGDSIMGLMGQSKNGGILGPNQKIYRQMDTFSRTYDANEH